MTNFGEHYNEELAQQEIEINKKTLWEMVGAFIVLTAVWGLAFGRFPTVNAIVFSVTYAISAGFFIASVILFFKADPSDERMKNFFVAGICIISAAMNLMFSYHMVLVYVFPLIVAVQYKEKNVLWLSYALEVFLLPVSMIVGFYYGICDLNLFLGSNHTRDWYLEQWEAGTLQFGVEPDPLFVILFYGALPRAVILLMFTVILCYISISSHEDAQKIANLTYRKETDLGTHVYNKNKYEEMIETYYPEVHRLAAIFWDANNLKYVNDKYGHAAGDVLIQTLSSVLYELSTDRRKVYRVGGDEFVMIIENPVETEIESMIETVKADLMEKDGQGDIPISSAVGWAEGCGVDIRKIVNEADTKMYENKKRGKEGRE